MAPTVDDAFLASLLGDLDADAFTPLIPSSKKPNSPLKHTHNALRPTSKRISGISRSALAAPGSPAGSSSTSASASSTPASPAVRARARPERPQQQPAPNPKPASGLSTTVHAGSDSFWGAWDAGCKPERAGPAPGDKNAPAAEIDGKDKGKGKGKVAERAPAAKGGAIAAGEVDFDALLDGMDWTDDLDLDMGEVIKPAKAGDGARKRLARAGAAGSVPHSKQFTRCTVLDVFQGTDPTTNRPSKTLHVRPHGTNLNCQVELVDDWFETPLELDDTINLIGPFAPTSTPSLTISRLSNLLVLHPDLLVSATKVADSAHCARKALLQELIRSSGGSTPALAYGNMLHELMQACLMEDRWDRDWIGERIDDIVGREVPVLWGMGLEVSQAQEEMRRRSDGFRHFARVFAGEQPSPHAFLSDFRANSNDPGRARLAVTSTIEVEEDIWSPKYGLKGKIDVSVAARVAEHGATGAEAMMPFEIKTGKSVGGMEHRAQTMLYTLLMSDRYDDHVDSGLLYYSQSGELIKIQAARNEIRGLVIARNEFATYLHRRGTLTVRYPHAPVPVVQQEEDKDEFDCFDDDPLDADVAKPLLPAPIDDFRSCKWCYVGDACAVYRRAVEGELALSDDGEEPVQALFYARAGHLTAAQAEFFRQWERLISLEEQELVRFKKEIWTMGAEERAKLGRCLANLAIDQAFVPGEEAGAGTKIHRFTYRLRPACRVGSGATLLGGSIAANDPVVVSVEQPNMLAISRGFVLEITADAVVLGLDHTLTESVRLPDGMAAEDLVFRVDKDELAAGLGRIRDNLLQLFVAKGGDKDRRRLVVDLEAPTFEKQLSAAAEARVAGADLNEDQRSALRLVLRASDYALVLGMPGTGKTTTIAEMLKQLVAEGKTVLLTSYTHSAVDTILLKVKDAGLNILRLGNRDKIMPQLHRFTLDPHNPPATLAQMDTLLMEPQVVATTCLGVNDPLFSRRTFDVCIVDEASQVTLPTCLGPLRFARKFVLVGDHHQLPPLVRNPAAREGGLDVSLFKRLSDAHPASVACLAEQYRMNDDIMALSNTMVYGGRLRAGSEAVGRQVLKLPRRDGLNRFEAWVREVLDPGRSVIFVDTDALPGRERKAGPLIDNPTEAAILRELTSALVACGVPPSSVGVIAPYRHQTKLLAHLLADEPAIEVLTADRSQGRDKDCILMSLVRSNADGHVGELLKDWRRWNVCLTRAKSKLVVVGSRRTLEALELMRSFFEVVDECGWGYRLSGEAVITGGREGAGEGSRAVGVKAGLGVAAEVAGQRKKARRSGAGELVMRSPLVKDVLNTLL